ncbi:MAG: hypothetical protein IRY99_10635, partial [Isosphaeraceae bacterium]|nr:hypothetical protein [Isosphaeraceae bacterium]
MMLAPGGHGLAPATHVAANADAGTGPRAGGATWGDGFSPSAAPMSMMSGGGRPSLYLDGGGAYENSDGTYVDIVGDGVNAVLCADPERELQSVEWTVQGPGQVFEDQVYTLANGHNIYYQFPVVHSVIGASNDYFHFYWGSAPGAYTITAKANYFDGSDTETLTVSVLAPSLNSIQMTQMPMQLGLFHTIEGREYLGIHQGDPWDTNSPTYGDVVQASVTMPMDPGFPFPSPFPGGVFAFLQKVNVLSVAVNNKTMVHSQTSMGDYVLDDNGESWFQRSWNSDYYPSVGQTITLPPPPADGKAPSVFDAPNLGWLKSEVGDPNADYATYLEVQDDFKTYLM